MYAIEMNNITMTFGNFKANDNITLKVEQGEVHALIGENGAGKSTLMSILFGLYKPTTGTIKINGEHEVITSPIHANELGIGMVHQHFKLVEDFTVLENITLNFEDTIVKTFVTYKDATKKINAIMDKFNFRVDLNKKISECTVAEQQRVEIIKMLYRDADILIFDEPTAVLTPKQIEDFLRAILDLKSKGKTIIIISHKLDELKQVADKGTVIRRGKMIGSFDMAKTSKEEIAKMMVGEKVEETTNSRNKVVANPVLEIAKLSVNKNHQNILGLKEFDLVVNKGEIVAIAGVEGNGQHELINAISGLQKSKQGEILLTHKDKFGKDVKTNISKISIKKRYKLGLSHIPEDRHKYGSVLDMNMVDNAILQDHDTKDYSKFGIVNKKAATSHTQEIVKNYDVRSAFGIKSMLRTLSGGNQQKLIVGREMMRNSDFILIAQPTRGLDVGAIKNIHEKIIEAKEKGKGILLISYELDEVLALADRVVVINAGRKVDEVVGKDINKNTVGVLMTGSSSNTQTTSLKHEVAKEDKVEAKPVVKKVETKSPTKKTTTKVVAKKAEVVKKETSKATPKKTASKTTTKKEVVASKTKKGSK